MSVTFTPRVLWITQTQPAGSRTARELRRLGYFTLAVPLVRSRVTSRSPSDERRSVWMFVAAVRDALSYLPRIDGVLIYSVEEARRFRRLLARRSWQGTIFCMTDDCAAELRQCEGVTVLVSGSAEEDAMIALVRQW